MTASPFVYTDGQGYAHFNPSTPITSQASATDLISGVSEQVKKACQGSTACLVDAAISNDVQFGIKSRDVQTSLVAKEKKIG